MMDVMKGLYQVARERKRDKTGRFLYLLSF